MLTKEQMQELLDDVAYKPNHKIMLKRDDPTNPSDRWYIQVEFWRMDVVTKTWGWGKSGKRFFSMHCTPSEFLRVVFGTLDALEEHELRESFTYKGKRIFGPHISVEALLAAADTTDMRSTDG